jgi:hypothetical protein
MIPQHKLVPGKTYYIYQICPYFPPDFYKGTLIVKTRIGVCRFSDMYAFKPLKYLGELDFGTNAFFYDAEKVKENAIKARLQMEKRALDMILKRIVNEEFTWV